MDHGLNILHLCLTFSLTALSNKYIPLFLSLGYYGNIYLLTDHFLDLYQQSSVYRKQAAMVLNEIIRGAAGIAVATEGQGVESQVRGHSPTQEDLKVAVVSVMEEYTSLKNWHLITVSEETDIDRQDQQVRIASTLQL